jgi:hypothetical protein
MNELSATCECGAGPRLGPDRGCRSCERLDSMPRGPRAMDVVDILRKRGPSETDHLMFELKASRNTVQQLLGRMRNRGLVENVGGSGENNDQGVWRLIEGQAYYSSKLPELARLLDSYRTTLPKVVEKPLEVVRLYNNGIPLNVIEDVMALDPWQAAHIVLAFAMGRESAA